MQHEIDTELLNELLAAVEVGWRDRHDRTVAYRLAEAHPEYRDQLLEFFEDLVLGADENVSADVNDAENRVSQWIQTVGVGAAVAAAVQAREGESGTTEMRHVATDRPGNRPSGSIANKGTDQVAPKTWLAFLKERLNRGLPQLAAALPQVTTEYLALASRHPTLLPDSARRALAGAVEDCWQVPLAESMQYLNAQPAVARAASRSAPFAKEPTTFQELLDRAALSPEQKAFWMAYDKGA